MSAHTPEPWKRGEEHETKVEIQEGVAPYHHVATVHGSGVIFARYPDHRAMQDNARRIVACVNACAGIPTEALEAGVLEKVVGEAIEAHAYLLAASMGLGSKVKPDHGYQRDLGERIGAALRSIGRLR